MRAAAVKISQKRYPKVFLEIKSIQFNDLDRLDPGSWQENCTQNWL